jgi:hypothetical protein
MRTKRAGRFDASSAGTDTVHSDLQCKRYRLMPVELKHLRMALMPGVSSLRCTYAADWAEAFADNDLVLAASELPTISLPLALAAGAAAVVISNPSVTRRGLFGWLPA